MPIEKIFSPWGSDDDVRERMEDLGRKNNCMNLLHDGLHPHISIDPRTPLAVFKLESERGGR